MQVMSSPATVCTDTWLPTTIPTGVPSPSLHSILLRCHPGVTLGSVSLMATLLPGANAKSAEPPSFSAGTVWPVMVKLNAWFGSPVPAFTRRTAELALVIVQLVLGWAAGFSNGAGMTTPDSEAVADVTVRSCGTTWPADTKNGSQKVHAICLICQFAGTAVSCTR